MLDELVGLTRKEWFHQLSCLQAISNSQVNFRCWRKTTNRPLFPLVYTLIGHRNGVIKWSERFKKILNLALAGFHTGPLSWWNRNLECWFLRRKENQKTGKIPSEQGENQRQTQPTYGTGPESNPSHTGGRRALSPLCHPNSPVPLEPLARCWWFHLSLENFMKSLL